MKDIKGLLIRILEDEFSNKYAFVGTVKTVTGNLITVTALTGGGEYSDIRLQAHPGNGILIIPSVGSYVIVGRMTGNSGYVAMTSAADSIQLLDGSYGGLIKIDDLVTKINNLEQDLNTLKSNFTGWVVVPNDGGLALKTATTTWSGNTITETVNADLENTDITHGAV